MEFNSGFNQHLHSEDPEISTSVIRKECSTSSQIHEKTLESSHNSTLEMFVFPFKTKNKSLVDEKIEVTTIVSTVESALTVPSKTNSVTLEDYEKKTMTRENIDYIVDEKLLNKNIEWKLKQYQLEVSQKNNLIILYEREHIILEKEKEALRKEKEMEKKEKESIVIKFAMQEKLLIDSKKEKQKLEKQLENAKYEIKNTSARVQTLAEEKSRMGYIIDEKCNEARKYQKECEKLNAEKSSIEMKLKYHLNKCSMEVETRNTLKKKIDEGRKLSTKVEESVTDKIKAEYEANVILLKHEIENVKNYADILKRELDKSNELNKQLEGQLESITSKLSHNVIEIQALKYENTFLERSYNGEVQKSRELLTQLQDVQLVRSQNHLYEEKINVLNLKEKDLNSEIATNKYDLKQLYNREIELLRINKEMSELLVKLQYEISILNSKHKGLESDNEFLKRRNNNQENIILYLKSILENESIARNNEKLLLTRHLSEKTKLYEITKLKLEQIFGFLEASQNKQNTVFKILLQKLRRREKTNCRLLLKKT